MFLKFYMETHLYTNKQKTDLLTWATVFFMIMEAFIAAFL